MTTTTRHIEDLGVDEWAALTRRAAVEAVAAAERRGKTPPPELVALTGMTERQLVERRARNGPASRRLSPLMQFLEADHMRRIAEGRARDAHQDKLDAEAVAAAARVEAQQRAAERTAASEAAEQTAQQLRGELERVRADADAEIAASRGWAAGEAAAVREAADAEVARAYAAADEAIRQAQARAARTLSMPVPPFEFRTETAHIENALNAAPDRLHAGSRHVK